MKKTLAVLFALLLVLGGCLELDAQDITIHYDAAKDRIDLHFVHRGLFAEGEAGSNKDPMAKALADLAEVRGTGKVVFWCNWPFAVDPTSEAKAPAAALLAHIDVENGELFTDPQGVLCGHQFVRIRDAQAFVQKLNSLFELWVQSQLLGGSGDHKFDGETKELVTEFLRSGEKMLKIAPGRLELRLPLSPADHTWFKAQFEKLFLDNMPREIVRRTGVAERRAAGGAPTETMVRNADVKVGGEQLKEQVQKAASYRFFWDNEWSGVRTPELTTVALGVAGGQELRITKASDGLYHDALLKVLREKNEKIEESVPDQELARRFAAFRERDAALPPKLAEVRGKGALPKADEKKADEKEEQKEPGK